MAGNNFTLINGSLANEGKQDVYHWLQNGYSEIKGFPNGISDYAEYVNPTLDNLESKIIKFVTIVPTGFDFSSDSPILGLVGNNSDIRYVILFNNSKLRIIKPDSTNTSTVIYETIDSVITDENTPYNVEVHFKTYTDYPLLFINGVEISSFTVAGNIGSLIGTNTLRFYYNMRFGYGKFRFNDLEILNESLVTEHLWKIDEGQGSVLYDSVGDLDMTLYSSDLSSFWKNYYIPASSALNGTDALGNQLTIQQDGHSFLDTGTKLKHRQMARVVQADEEEFWYDSTLEEMKSKEFSEFIGVELSNKIFNDISTSGKMTNCRSHKAALERKQLDTELKITNND